MVHCASDPICIACTLSVESAAALLMECEPITLPASLTFRFQNLAQVQQLLFDQQRQIDLLMRGQFSLRGNINSIRRTSKEMEGRNKQLQEELEQQHGAALR